MRCASCGHRYSAIAEVRDDPDGRVPRVWRRRRCRSCDAEWWTSEVIAGPGPRRVRFPDPPHRLSELRTERYLLARAGGG